MSTALVVNDLVLRTKIKEAAASASREVVFLRTAEQVFSTLAQGDNSITAVVIDLHATSLDPMSLAAELAKITPRPTLIGFFSHVQPELGVAAQSAGYDTVLPRSKFFGNVEAFLK